MYELIVASWIFYVEFASVIKDTVGIFSTSLPLRLYDSSDYSDYKRVIHYRAPLNDGGVAAL